MPEVGAKEEKQLTSWDTVTLTTYQLLLRGTEFQKDLVLETSVYSVRPLNLSREGNLVDK